MFPCMHHELTVSVISFAGGVAEHCAKRSITQEIICKGFPLLGTATLFRPVHVTLRITNNSGIRLIECMLPIFRSGRSTHIDPSVAMARLLSKTSALNRPFRRIFSTTGESIVECLDHIC